MRLTPMTTQCAERDVECEVGCRCTIVRCGAAEYDWH